MIYPRQVSRSRRERIKNVNADLKRFILCILLIECQRKFKNRPRKQQEVREIPNFLHVLIKTRLEWFVWVSNAKSIHFSVQHVKTLHVKLLTNTMINLFLLVTNNLQKEFWSRENQVNLWPMLWIHIVRYWKNWKKMSVNLSRNNLRNWTRSFRKQKKYQKKIAKWSINLKISSMKEWLGLWWINYGQTVPRILKNSKPNNRQLNSSKSNKSKSKVSANISST